MSRAPVFAVAIACALVPVASASAVEMHRVVKADAIQWMPGPAALPKGGQVAVLAGDPGKEGLFILRAKLPDGYAIPAHWHSKAEHVTVLSGTFNLGMGDRLDKMRGEAVGPGGFFAMPAGMRHYGWASGETVIEVTGTGPFDIHYVDPKDHPSQASRM